MFGRVAVLCLVTLLPLSAVAQKAPAGNAKQTFVFNDEGLRDTVTFVLDAPLEMINGLSNQVKGSVTIENNKASGRMAVPVNSIKTGNESRDGHLQNEKWLDAAKYPDIIVEFKDLALPGPLESGKPVKLKTQGKFTIHGVTREEPIEITASYMKESADTQQRAPGDLLRVRARFQIPLEAYKINRQGPLILKVAEVADVTVDAWGSTQFKL
jgi:polyisoprenoid-binding protein YceI